MARRKKEAWWRVFKGVYPYRWAVVVSLICALGVGISYASGVAVLVPVMKIFVSVEGVHGWSNRNAAAKRIHADIKDLDATTSQLENTNKPSEYGLIINYVESDAPEVLRAALAPRGTTLRTITRVKLLPGPDGTVHPVDDKGTPLVQSDQSQNKQWQNMVKMLALAERGQPLELEVEPGAGAPAEHVTVMLEDLPWYKRSFTNIIEMLPTDKFQSLAYVVVFFIVLCVIGSVFRYWQQFIGMTVANRVVMDLRRRAYDRVVQLPASYFAQQGTSDVMSRLTQDTNTLTDGVSMALGKAIQEPVKAFFAFCLAIYTDWRLCLLVVLSMPILGIIIRKFSKRMRRASRGALENWAMMLAVINETLIGVRVVKAYSAEGYERRRFARVNKAILKEQIKLNRYASLSRPTIETMAVVLSAGPMMAAAYFVLKGNIKIDSAVLLLACFVAMLEPLRKLSDVNSKVQQSNAAATRVFEIVDMQPEPNYPHNLPRLERHSRAIEFKDITFHYPGHEEMVLQGISLTVQRGQTVAVVGGNGSGKTTLLTLLPRLYVPTTGTVLVDGVDISGVSLRSLRKQIGLVTQDTVLFADTIYNNIAYGTRHATREQVMDAAKKSFTDEFVQGLEHGYETRVGEHGVRLSGGQKQRIAIARAILHDPAILILDEAMSQIDSDSEMKISLALREFTKNRTTFMIAHRFQTVISADVIVCLDKGRLVGMGTHQELIASCDAYKKLYENQFKEGAA